MADLCIQFAKNEEEAKELLQYFIGFKSERLAAQRAEQGYSPDEKRCKICYEYFPLKMFNKSKMTDDGHTDMCKECMKRRRNHGK